MSESKERLVNPEPRPDDRLDQALRPKTLAELIGQERIKENIAILMQKESSSLPILAMYEQLAFILIRN